MFEIFGKLKMRFIFCFLVIAYCVSSVAYCELSFSHSERGVLRSSSSATAEGVSEESRHPSGNEPLCLDGPVPPNGLEGVWDPARYITIDEVQPGMEAYCLTAYKGTEIEKFDMEVLSVVRNIRPGRDAILVQGTDERFIHTGPVSGCSGSPVYIDGRLAGALAFGWYFSKDPLYGVTPIEEMLRVGKAGPSKHSEGAGNDLVGVGGFGFDFSKPIDFAEIDRKITTPRLLKQRSLTGATILPCPLITSGLPAQVTEQLNTLVEPFGLMAVSGIGGDVDVNKAEKVQLVPGACLAVPLVTGDIAMEAIATVTEVEGDKVYGFGHRFLGYGPIDLPMATGHVHTVVSRVIFSFKFATALEIVGALTTDESAAVCGRIGAKARMIPLTISVDRYNDPQKRVYNCQVADNRLLTPLVLRYVVAGATLMLGSLPPDHMIEYKVTIATEGTESITFENVSTSVGLTELIMESVGPVAILLNNPYKKVDIKSIDFDIRIVPKNITSLIWSVDLSDSKVKAGQSVEISVVVESVRRQKKKYRCRLKIPQNLAPGKYDLIVCGGYAYQDFLREATPYKFVPQSLTTLVEAMNNLLAISREKLYCLLILPPAGLAVEKAELPDLPATKALVLQDAKRVLRTQPYPRWLESIWETGTVVADKKVTYITVEE